MKQQIIALLKLEANIEIVEDQKVIDWLWETQDKTFFDSKRIQIYVCLSRT